MRNSGIKLAAALVLAGAVHAYGQDESTPEAMAVIQPGEVGSLLYDSVRAFGATKRFEASILWADSGVQRPPDHLTRKVRYLADCGAGTLTVVAVGVYDRSGQLLKSLISPPGAADPAVPAPGSPQARWLEQVCRE